MNFLTKHSVKIFKVINPLLLLKNYTLNYYFSRFGNNLQQIAIGVLYSKIHKGNFYSPPHEHIKEFSVINNEIFDKFSLFKKRYRFFYFHDKKDFAGKKLKSEDVINNIQKTFKEHIRKNIKFLKDHPIDEDTLVIHIRSGDIFIDKKKDYYQNPINFYIEIMKEYKKVVVVTSEDKLNPICSELEKISKVTFQTLSMETDFNILYNSKNLATSGVGTFPIAAALLSKELNNFYYTNLYLDEHLNPKMLKDSKIVHHKYNINSSYIYEYEKQVDIKNLILDKSIEVQKEN